MSQSYFIGLSALAIIAWAFYIHVRIGRLETRLAVADEEVKDNEIVAHEHTLSDADMDAKMSDFFRPGNKSDNR